MPLPTQKRGRKTRIDESNTLLFGEPKIGKSTLVAQMPNAVILDTENGTGFLDVFMIPVTDYSTFIQAVRELTEQSHAFSPICIDTLDNVVRFCASEVCRTFGVKDLADLPYGKGYSVLANGLMQLLAKLASLGRGLWLTAHVKEVEVDLPGGSKALRAEPSLSSSLCKQVLAFCDFVIFLHPVEVPGVAGGPPTVTRVLETKPTSRWYAGDRTGKLPAQLPCDYTHLNRAFEAALAANAGVAL
jgi:hypothetical protein